MEIEDLLRKALVERYLVANGVVYIPIYLCGQGNLPSSFANPAQFSAI